MPKNLPALDAAFLDRVSPATLAPALTLTHPPRFLLLYGSLRERSYSRLLVEEAARLLRALGAETRIFDPRGLPQPDLAREDHPKVAELRALSLWSEGQVWCSPERHGAMTGVFKTQIDWLPLESAGMRPTQGRTLAVCQVNAGSQSFNTVNQLRILGRWMRMITIPNQSSVPKAFDEFDDVGRMKPSAYYDRLVDVMEELVKFTLLTRERSSYLVDRYSERKAQGAQRVEACHGLDSRDSLVDWLLEHWRIGLRARVVDFLRGDPSCGWAGKKGGHPRGDRRRRDFLTPRDWTALLPRRSYSARTGA